MDRNLLNFLGGYGTFILFISALTETNFFDSIPRINQFFGTKWIITLIISVIVSGQALFLNYYYKKSLLVSQVVEVEISKFIKLIVACLIFVFAILAEKNVESSIAFVCSAIGFVGYAYCVERLTGWPTFGIPEVVSAVVMESARTLPFPVNYGTVFIAGLFVVRRTLSDKVGRNIVVYFDVKHERSANILMGLTTILFELGLFFLSQTKLVSKNRINLLDSWYSFSITSIMLVGLHFWLCKAILMKIRKDKKIERVGRFVFVGICITIFIICYIANSYLEKSGYFVGTLTCFLLDLTCVHILIGIPQFGTLEIFAAMIVGVAYDLEPPSPIYLFTFVVGLGIVIFNWYFSNRDLKPSTMHHQISTTSTTSSPPSTLSNNP